MSKRKFESGASKRKRMDHDLLIKCSNDKTQKTQQIQDLRKCTREFSRTKDAADKFVQHTNKIFQKMKNNVIEIANSLPQSRKKKKTKQFHDYEADDDPITDPLHSYEVNVYNQLCADFACLGPNNFKPDVTLPKNALIGVFDKICNYCPGIMYEDFRNEYIDFISKWKEIKKNIDCVYTELQDYDENIDAFVKSGVGYNSKKPNSFVVTKFDNWRKALEGFQNHSETNYHKTCLSDSEHFLKVQKNINEDISVKLDSSRKNQIMKNRELLTPIIEAIILCGRQNIAIRGHRDSGKLMIDQTDNEYENNEGNFREILRYRARGDEQLKLFLESNGHLKYTSATIQNEIIESCNQILLKRIVSRVNSAQCFSILADETADIANIEQVALCLASLILENLHNFGIETKYMRGQGYDGAAAMSGEFNGVQAIIRKTHPLALYVHCSAHVLNLAVSNSCKVQEIRNCLGTISKARDFFNFPKRKDVLKTQIENSDEKISKKSLKRLCATRWIERYHAVNDFEELFDQVIESLNFISEWKDVETSSHASNLCSAILEGGFIISMLIVAKCFSVGLPLSKHLQRVNIDLGEAIQLAEDTIKELEDFRKNADSIFQDIFENAVSLGNKFGVTISIPRTTKRQANRVNVETDSIEVYYRIAIFIPYIETFIEQLKVRFTSHKAILVNFNSLISLNTDENNFLSLTETYMEDLSSSSKTVLLSEYNLWQRRLRNLETSNYRNAMEALSICNPEIYPNIFKLLTIFATLPVSTAQNERSFSSLKKIKTYLRNTMGQKRLNGLAMLSINRKDRLESKQVLDELAVKKRRLPLIL
ncbi:52 kDa repressor of the inhibitor of the protein kinase-like [Acyrthosiphon pisum]|uniref:HAT C-terminal dimerisation domain-containing protein n=1 Tax=Acyrthosiphon pisum TaxID=7029 RepID=A0A8R2B9Q3_ACYPI|nr:52 kDa repressor of the inhibitor of the protein kinase-like [Acyrthosiphon pisum]|eukprot:XP_008187861.1 PREDICTED: 52 kDa repressor of the inhibitor of the protein kinase-like [Acyrthosiphon pisum]